MVRDKELVARMIWQANSFLYASSLLEANPSSRNENIAFPAMVTNANLALEIYLKAIHAWVAVRPIPQIHNVDKLFKNLPRGTQQDITKIYNKIEIKPPISLLKLLEKSALYFETFRYFYDEPRKGEYYHVYGAIEAMGEFLISVDPKLVEYSDQMRIARNDITY